MAWILQLDALPNTNPIVRSHLSPPFFPGWWRKLNHFWEGLYREVKLGFWVRIGTLDGGDFFQVGLENSLKTKCTENDSDFNLYNFSLLFPCPNNFLLLVCICILISHGIYSPPLLTIFFLWGLKFFYVSCS